MTEQQLQVVENKYPKIDTENQVEQWEYTIDGYNVAIFYTSKDSNRDRYINAILTNLDTNENIYIEPIKMLEPYEIEVEDDQTVDDINVDVEDLNSINREIYDYLEQKRLEPLRKQYLARRALKVAAEAHRLDLAA